MSGIFYELLDHPEVVRTSQTAVNLFLKHDIHIMPILQNYAVNTITYLQNMVKRLTAAGIERGVMLGLDVYSMDPTFNVDMMHNNLHYAKYYFTQHDIDLLIFGGYDPTRPLPEGVSPAEALDNLFDQFDGLKIYPKLWNLTTHECVDVFRMIAKSACKAGKPVTMHCSGGGVGDHVENINPGLWWDVFNRFPGLNLIFAHGGGGFDSKRYHTIKFMRKEGFKASLETSFHSAAYHDKDHYFNRLREELDDPFMCDGIGWASDDFLQQAYKPYGFVPKLYRDELGECLWERMSKINSTAILFDGVQDVAQI